MVVGLLVRGSAMIEATVANGPVMLAYTIISIATGVAMIVGHNVWSGGALSVVVTLVGWLIFGTDVLRNATKDEQIRQHVDDVDRFEPARDANG